MEIWLSGAAIIIAIGNAVYTYFHNRGTKASQIRLNALEECYKTQISINRTNNDVITQRSNKNIVEGKIQFLFEHFSYQAELFIKHNLPAPPTLEDDIKRTGKYMKFFKELDSTFIKMKAEIIDYENEVEKIRTSNKYSERHIARLLEIRTRTDRYSDSLERTERELNIIKEGTVIMEKRMLDLLFDIKKNIVENVKE